MSRERERVVVSGLFLLMMVLWLGFFVHRSPRFAGSALGGVLGVSGSVLMMVPFAYMLVKRLPRLKSALTRWVSMRTLLTWHIYAGVAGPILVVLHTGHKFDSALGVALTAMTLIVVASGFVGRYLLTYISSEIRDLKTRLGELKTEMGGLRRRIREEPPDSLGVLAIVRSRISWSAWGSLDAIPPQLLVIRIADAIADTEYALSSHERLKRMFRAWLKLHIVLSLVLYVLLGLHVWAGIHFGLRWLG